VEFLTKGKKSLAAGAISKMLVKKMTALVVVSFFNNSHDCLTKISLFFENTELDTAAMMAEAEGKYCADVAFFSWQTLQTLQP
jgi:hypothetical protein